MMNECTFSVSFGDDTEISRHVTEFPGKICLKVDVRKNKDAARLHEMLCLWQQAAAMLEAGEISLVEYDRWHYHYPEFDKAQNYVKMPPQDINKMFVRNVNEQTMDNM